MPLKPEQRLESLSKMAEILLWNQPSHQMRTQLQLHCALVLLQADITAKFEKLMQKNKRFLCLVLCSSRPQAVLYFSLSFLSSRLLLKRRLYSQELLQRAQVRVPLHPPVRALQPRALSLQRLSQSTRMILSMLRWPPARLQVAQTRLSMQLMPKRRSFRSHSH